MKSILSRLYPPDQAQALSVSLAHLIQGIGEDRFAAMEDSGFHHRVKRRILDDACLICYADTLFAEDSKQTPLALLKDFLLRYRTHHYLSILHLLPFFPWDADRGFSVKDYYRVHPDYGSWSDINALAGYISLMFDFVINHASVQNPIVQASLIERHLPANDPRYPNFAPFKNFVIAFSDKNKPTDAALKGLVRPRPTPVLTPYVVFEKKNKALFARLTAHDAVGPTFSMKKIGTGWVWTTFSRPSKPDGTLGTRQVDLNFKNPAVFLESTKILIHYIKKGASLIRLDAVGYIWKNSASSSIHEPQVHAIIRVLRRFVKRISPKTRLVAEVNEPQEKILPYLGKKGQPECDLVYQFAHFPLAVYSVLTGDAIPYMKWLKSLDVFTGRQFITILGSHDGMGLKPAQGWLDSEQIDRLLFILIREHGALPNFAALPGGKQIVYEICATPWNLINNPEQDEPVSLAISRYLTVVALGFLVRGIPAFYINGLIGANNAPKEGLDENRSINRRRLETGWLFKQLDGGSVRMKNVFQEITRLLEKRRQQPAFDPRAPAAQPIFLENPGVVCAWLPSRSRRGGLLACISVSLNTEKAQIPRQPGSEIRGLWKDILSGERFAVDEKGCLELELKPYQILWMKSHRKTAK